MARHARVTSVHFLIQDASLLVVKKGKDERAIITDTKGLRLITKVHTVATSQVNRTSLHACLARWTS